MIDYCEEYGEIIALVPVPAGQCQHDLPFSVQSPSVSAGAITLSAVGSSSQSVGYAPAEHPSSEALFRRSGFFVDGYDLRASASTIITIRKKPSVKGSYKRALNGETYTVKVSAHTEDQIHDVQSFVNTINSYDYFDLFIVDTQMRCYLVRGVMPATSLKFDQQLPTYNNGDISFEIQCVNGVQPILS